MVANPITNAEIKAWKELNEIETTPWEVSLLIQMDNAVLAKQNINKNQKEPEVEVEASDSRGIMSMMQRLGAKLGMRSG